MARRRRKGRNIQVQPVQQYVTEMGLQSVMDEAITALMRESLALGRAVDEDADQADWTAVDRRLKRSLADSITTRNEARELAREEPHCKRAIALYGHYIGSAAQIRLYKDDEEDVSDSDTELIKEALTLWEDTLEHNQKWWTSRELAIRTYRDGECFVRKLATNRDGEAWPPEMRFVDPEVFCEAGDEEKGVIVDDADPSNVLGYRLWSYADDKQIDILDPSEIQHLKVDVDSTEVRGVTRLYACIYPARMLMGLMKNEVVRRLMQSAIVLHRTVKGTGTATRSIYDNAQTSTSVDRQGNTVSREKFKPGTTITTNEGVDLKFVQPDGSFSNAEPLVKQLIQHIACATGWTYEMLSADVSGGNLASLASQESPTMQMVMEERQFVGAALLDLFWWVMEVAVAEGKVDAQIMDFRARCEYPQPWSGDTLKKAQETNLGIMNQTISRAEGSRRAGVDPAKMRREIKEEAASGVYNAGFNNQNPDMADKTASSNDNAAAGGTNRGDAPVQHDDNQGTGKT